jgi:hypothetical protein
MLHSEFLIQAIPLSGFPILVMWLDSLFLATQPNDPIPLGLRNLIGARREHCLLGPLFHRKQRVLNSREHYSETLHHFNRRYRYRHSVIVVCCSGQLPEGLANVVVVAAVNRSAGVCGETGAHRSRHQARYDLAAVPAVDFEIRVSRDNHGIRQRLGQAHQAGIGQAHGHIGVFGAQVEDLRQFIREIEGQPQMAPAQKLVERPRVGRVQEKKRLGQNGLAGEPWQGLPGQGFARPCVMFFTRIKQRGQWPAVNDAVSWHG